MKDIIDKLASDVKQNVIESCAKVAEIHLQNPDMPGAEYYNNAVREIAAKIRKLV